MPSHTVQRAKFSAKQIVAQTVAHWQEDSASMCDGIGHVIFARPLAARTPSGSRDHGLHDGLLLFTRGTMSARGRRVIVMVVAMLLFTLLLMVHGVQCCCGWFVRVAHYYV